MTTSGTKSQTDSKTKLKADSGTEPKAGSKPGSQPGRRRKKGGPDNFTVTIRDMIVGALARAGGEEYLLHLAEEEPKTFISLVSKVLPLQEGGEGGGPLTINIVRFSGEEKP